MLLNHNGDLPNDAERAQRRYLTIDTQDGHGMSRIHGRLDPEALRNPDDETPCVVPG